MKYYQNYHKHDSNSNIYLKDSPVTVNDYLEYYKSLDCPQIFSTVQHGWQSPYFRIYDDIEKFNKKNGTDIKFIFGTEAYWVKDRHEKDNSNCHIVLLAKNDNGRKAINKALSIANKDGFYYRPRLDLELLLGLPKDDVFVTTACVAFWNKYGDIDDIVLKFNEHFTDFYLEVQAHNTDKQREINRHIIDLSETYNIPIIFGADSHYIYDYQTKDRDELLLSGGISYEDEDGWYMDCPSYEVAVRRLQEQGILTDEQIETSLQNTNKILDFEDIQLDRSLKVPVIKKYQHLSQDERNEVFKQILRNEWKAQYQDINKSKLQEYVDEIQHDIDEIISCGMADYFILSYEVMKLGQEKYGGILTPTGRGSAVSMYINKLLRLTKVDRINSPVLMYPERFLTSTRVLESHTPPDIDNNVSDREPFIQAQRELLGDLGTYDLIALGTLHYKSAFKMYARAHNLDPQIANEVTKGIANYEQTLKHAEDDEKDSIDIYNYVDKEAYGELIEGCQKYRGIIDNIKGHPCATIALNGDVESEIGIILCKSEATKREVLTAVIESGTIDSFGYLKQDYLIVDSIGLTYDIYKEIGIKPYTVNELMKKIDGDKNVWDIYANGYTMCVNQCEQPKSTQKVMKYKPQNIYELTQFIAGIRPSFQSMYKIFESREHFDYGVKALDNLLQDEYCDSSFIIYQENLMKVLGFAGFPMSETYTIIKAISKKKDYIIKDAKPRFITNFAQAILDTGETDNNDQAHELAEKVWKIIEDAAAYGFNSAHAFCMAIDSVTIAYLKAYYPMEFYKCVLQRYTDKGEKDKVLAIKKEMHQRNILMKPLTFGDDNRKFSIDQENNCIIQTMASIKNISKIVPQQLYELGKKKFNNFIEVLYAIKDDTNLKKTDLDILIKINYFEEFGDIHSLLYAVELFNKYGKCKTIKKDKLTNEEISIVRQFSQKETEKQFSQIDNISIIEQLYLKNTITTTIYDIIGYQTKLLGYCDIIIAKDYHCVVLDIVQNNYGTTYTTLYCIGNGHIKTMKVDKQYLVNFDLNVGDVIKTSFESKPKKYKDTNDKWVNSNDYELILKAWYKENT